jgi:ankyrin repeat protein
MAISAKHNLYHVDIHGNNFLHEAARKDHHYIFYHALTNSGLKVKQLRKLLRQQNKYGLTPLLVALSILPHSNPANIRTYDDLFVVPGVWNRIHLIAHSSTLQTFSNIMIYLKYTCDLDISQDMDILINLLVRKYQILYIVMIIDLYAVTFWDVLRILDCKDMYFYFSLSLTISYLFLSQNLTEYCYDTNSNDILHTIIMNYRNRFWQHFESDIIWEHYFNGYPALMLDRCYNKEGYNLLHKAAMGGNYKFVKFLINRGMDIKTLTKTNQTIFNVCLQKFPFRIFTGHISQTHRFGVPPEFLEDIPKYTLEYGTGRIYTIYNNITNSINYDLVLQILINEFDQQRHKQKRSDFLSFASFCSVCKRKLSTVHVAAAKGYLELLKQIYTWHGEKALQCTSLHTISPFQLAHLYNQIPVIKWMANLKIRMFVPQKSVRLPLVMDYVTNFSYKPFYHWSCRLLYGNIHTNLFLVNMNKCVDMVRKTNNTCVLHTEELLNIKYLNFKSTLNSITGKQTISYKWITECKSRFNSVCSKKIRALSEAMKARKNTLNFYIHFIFKYYTSDFVKLTLFINSCVTILTKDIQLE